MTASGTIIKPKNLTIALNVIRLTILYWNASGTKIANASEIKNVLIGKLFFVLLVNDDGSCFSRAIASKIRGALKLEATLMPSIDTKAPTKITSRKISLSKIALIATTCLVVIKAFGLRTSPTATTPT